MTETFTAMMIREAEGGGTQAALEEITLSDLPENEVLVEISHSSLNYKDGLAITGKSPIARRLPMVGGIDLAGTVVESADPAWKPGDKVVVNGWGLSETQWGGYARYQRLKPGWLTKLPEGFSPAEAMAIGTAGYTAALCVDALDRWGALDGTSDRPVLVTGAGGGVGSVAVSLLAAMGHEVTAATGRDSLHPYLSGLGATGFVSREELQGKLKPLQKELWRAAIDTVGSLMLANVLAQTEYGGAVAACGLAGGFDLPATVMPHILRSVALIGVDSVMAPQERRARAWALLERHLDRAHLAEISETRKMEDLPELAGQIIRGEIRGRIVIEVG